MEAEDRPRFPLLPRRRVRFETPCTVAEVVEALGDPTMFGPRVSVYADEHGIHVQQHGKNLRQIEIVLVVAATDHGTTLEGWATITGEAMLFAVGFLVLWTIFALTSHRTGLPLVEGGQIGVMNVVFLTIGFVAVPLAWHAVLVERDRLVAMVQEAAMPSVPAGDAPLGT